MFRSARIRSSTRSDHARLTFRSACVSGSPGLIKGHTSCHTKCQTTFKVTHTPARTAHCDYMQRCPTRHPPSPTPHPRTIMRGGGSPKKVSARHTQHVSHTMSYNMSYTVIQIWNLKLVTLSEAGSCNGPRGHCHNSTMLVITVPNAAVVGHYELPIQP